MRPAIERDEALAGELEGDAHHRACLLAVDLLALVGIAGDRVDLRVLEDRHVEFRRVLGFGVVPQARRDLLRNNLHRAFSAWRLALFTPRRLAETRSTSRAWRPHI